MCIEKSTIVISTQWTTEARTITNKKCTVNEKNEIRYCVNERKFSCIASVLFIVISKIDFVRSFTHTKSAHWYAHTNTSFLPFVGSPHSIHRRRHHHPIFAFRYYCFVAGSFANWSIFAWFRTKSEWPKCTQRNRKNVFEEKCNHHESNRRTNFCHTVLPVYSFNVLLNLGAAHLFVGKSSYLRYVHIILHSVRWNASQFFSSSFFIFLRQCVNSYTYKSMMYQRQREAAESMIMVMLAISIISLDIILLFHFISFRFTSLHSFLVSI